MVQLECLTASIAAAVAVKPSTIYSVKIDNSVTGQSWCVRRCYSEFYELRNKIIDGLKELPNVDLVHPLIFKLFPRRSLFGSRRASVVKYRVVALQQFLRAILACVTSRDVRSCPPVYNQLSTYIEIFLACPQASRRLGQTCLPLRPNGRLLAGVPLGRSNSAEFSATSKRTQYHKDDWSIAGDAVGLWAASNSHGSSTNRLRRLASDPTLPMSPCDEPVVFREMILSRSG